jgi:hypothetical protein
LRHTKIIGKDLLERCGRSGAEAIKDNALWLVREHSPHFRSGACFLLPHDGAYLFESVTDKTRRKLPIQLNGFLSVTPGVKRNMYDDFEFNRHSLFCRWPEFPLAQCLHGIRVELLIDSMH